MRRLTSFAIAFAAAMAVGVSAKAASLYFELATATATTICAAPCFQVRVFIEEPTRALEIQAIQMDVDVQNATVAELPVPPATNTNTSGRTAINATYDNPDETSSELPWNLSATVGASPAAGFDALFVLAADTPFTVAGLDATRQAALACNGSIACPIQAAALPLNRVYMGRFNILGPAQGVTFGVKVAGITGEGLGDLASLNGGSCEFSSGAAGGNCSITGAPEPASMLLLGAALAGLSLVRRRI